GLSLRIEVINNIQKEKHRVVALFQMFTGCRVGDILKMEKGTIKYDTYKDKKILMLNIIGKGQKINPTRILNPLIIDIVADFIQLGQETKTKKNILFNDSVLQDDYYFLDRPVGIKGQIIGSKNLQTLYGSNYTRYTNDLKQALNNSGIDEKDYSSHCWRKDFAQDVWKINKDILELQALLRHSSIETTRRYLTSSGVQHIATLEKIQC
ncbi:unnamed protein product, partial [marine sediment metagenome]